MIQIKKNCVDTVVYNHNQRQRSDTTPEEFEIRSFSSTVKLSVHTNPSRKRRFSKTLFKPEGFENAGFSFSCEYKTFRKRSFSKMIASQ